MKGDIWNHDGKYVCETCGTRWPPSDTYRHWPIRLAWRPGSSTRLFATHGFQIGRGRVEERIFGWTLHIGALKVIFGKASEPKP